MTLRIAFALLFAAAAAGQSQDGNQPFKLEPGDYRWIQLTIRQTPSEVDCHYEVVKGNPTVHVELLPQSEFRSFERGHDYEKMAATPAAKSGDFRRVIETRGQYAVVVENARGAAPATVLLRLETKVDPKDVARTLTPRRRLTVILVSFAFFFTTVAWSGRRLLRAIRASE